MESEAPTALERKSHNPGKRYIRFGPFHVDLERREVFKQGVRLRIQDKAYKLLETLLQRPGEVVTREELRGKLWPSDTHVDFEANVNTTVNKLRQGLEDASGQSRDIQTFPRRGYCLVTPVEYVDSPPATIGRSRPAAARTSSRPPEEAAPFWQAGHAAAWAAIAILAGGMLFGAGIVKLWLAYAWALR